MHLFYTSAVDGRNCLLGMEESRHCIRVLRLGEGDMIDLTDGAGNFYLGRLTKVSQKGCEVDLVDVRPDAPKPWKLHVAIAPTKNLDRFEWFLEKATEIGIDQITPLICEHSERKSLKPERLTKVLVAAMKQSLRAWLPVLNSQARLSDFISMDLKEQKFMGYCESGNEPELQEVYTRGADTVILVGPEGDFSPGEVNLAMKAGYTPVSLGPARLRTETAGVVATHTISLVNRMK